MVCGKYVKFRVVIICLSIVAFFWLGAWIPKTYRTTDLNIKVVSGQGVPVQNALVVAAWLDRCSSHGSFRSVVFAKEQVTDSSGIATFPKMEIKTSDCIDQSQPSVGVFHSDYFFIGKSMKFIKKRVGLASYELIYDSEVEVIGKQCSDCFSLNTKVSMVVSKVEYREMSLAQKEGLPMLKGMVEKFGLDRKAVGK